MFFFNKPPIILMCHEVYLLPCRVSSYMSPCNILYSSYLTDCWLPPKFHENRKCTSYLPDSQIDVDKKFEYMCYSWVTCSVSIFLAQFFFLIFRRTYISPFEVSLNLEKLFLKDSFSHFYLGMKNKCFLNVPLSHK